MDDGRCYRGQVSKKRSHYGYQVEGKAEPQDVVLNGLDRLATGFDQNG